MLLTGDYVFLLGYLCTFSQSQITVNGNAGGAVSPMSYYQRPFSPSAYSLPGSLNSSIIMQHGRSIGKYSDNCDFGYVKKKRCEKNIRHKNETGVINTPLVKILL